MFPIMKMLPTRLVRYMAPGMIIWRLEMKTTTRSNYCSSFHEVGYFSYFIRTGNEFLKDKVSDNAT